MYDSGEKGYKLTEQILFNGFHQYTKPLGALQ